MALTSLFDLPQRIQDKIMPEPMSGCWIWVANRTHDGYATVWFDGTTRRMARIAYKLLRGEIPQGMQIDHLCRNRICVNPAHLEPVTARENSIRGDGGASGRRASLISRAINKNCKWGHRKEGKNLFIDSNGARCCRICANQRARKFRERKKSR